AHSLAPWKAIGRIWARKDHHMDISCRTLIEYSVDHRGHALVRITGPHHVIAAAIEGEMGGQRVKREGGVQLFMSDRMLEAASDRKVCVEHLSRRIGRR